MKNRNDISKLFIKSVITISLFLLLVISSNFRDLGKLSPIKTLKLHEIENDDDDDICTPENMIDREGQCEFVKKYCSSEGFINFFELRYCTFEGRPIPFWILTSFLLVLLFYILAVTSESFFCPTLCRLADSLQLSPNVAGATLLAFGNGSPDIFSTIASVQQNEIGQAIGSSVGGGMFVTSIVVSLVVLASKNVVPRVSRFPFLRDILFYISSVLLLFGACVYGKIFVWGSALFLLIYVAYVITIIISRYIYKKKKEETISMVSVPGFQAQVSKFLKDSEFKIEEDYVTDNLSNLAFADSSFAFDSHINSDSDQQEADEETSSKVFFSKIGLFMKKKKRKPIATNSIQVKEYSLLDEENIPVASLSDIEDLVEEEEEEIIINTSQDSFKYNLNRFIQLLEWEEKSIPKKIFTIIEFPRFLVQSLCIPSGDEDGYFRPFYIAHPVAIVLFGLTVFNGWKMHGGFLPGPIWPYFLVVSLIFSFIVFLSTNDQKPPAYEWIFIFLSMILSIMWIYFTAEELVSLLSSSGTLLNISTTIMGLTVLTWGNSVGDLVSNTIISAKGFPQMAISASYCAPLTNILLGLGLSFTIASISKKTLGFSLAGHLRSGLFFSFLFLLFNLVTTIVLLIISKFKYKKFYSIILILIYISFTTIALLTETGIIKVKLWRV